MEGEKMPVTVKDHSKEVMEAIGQALGEAMEEIGQRAEGYAKQIVPVDTGALRDSIGHEATDDSVTIYADRPYAAFVCLGTSKQKPQPYLRPAVLDHTQEYVGIMSNKLS